MYTFTSHNSPDQTTPHHITPHHTTPHHTASYNTTHTHIYPNPQTDIDSFENLSGRFSKTETNAEVFFVSKALIGDSGLEWKQFFFRNFDPKFFLVLRGKIICLGCCRSASGMHCINKLHNTKSKCLKGHL